MTVLQLRQHNVIIQSIPASVVMSLLFGDVYKRQLYAQDATRFKARDRTGAPQSAAWEQEKRNGELRMIGQKKDVYKRQRIN